MTITRLRNRGNSSLDHTVQEAGRRSPESALQIATLPTLPSERRVPHDYLHSAVIASMVLAMVVWDLVLAMVVWDLVLAMVVWDLVLAMVVWDLVLAMVV